MSASVARRAQVLAILVAALGYFVDIYDLVLFSVVRKPSLEALGVHDPKEILATGVTLLNTQMTGMLVGGVLWGVLGDKRGRLSVLFGSILLYSVANIANGFVGSVEAYAAMRFVAGVGLAGELGAGITLVSEIMKKESRGYGTMIVATIGLCGAVVAALIGDRFVWRTAYFVGGGLGLALLFLRVGVVESGLFQSVKSEGVARGNFFQLFTPLARLRRYAGVILIGVPIWYVVGILVTFSPEITKGMGLADTPSVGRAIMFTYVGLAIGDLASGALSQVLKSRRRVIGIFLGLTALAVVAYFVLGARSLETFYGVCVAMGIAAGYWAMFVTVASEQFGTNLRATATTTAPNFVRGAVVPLTSLFQLAQKGIPIVPSAILVGVLTMVLAFVALGSIEETFGRDLTFVER